MVIRVLNAEKVLASLDPGLNKKIQRMTLNKVGNTTVANIKRAITDVYAIRKSDLKIETRTATAAGMTYYIAAPARQRNIAAFKVKHDRRAGGGLYATVKKGQQEFIRSAFLAFINGNKLGVKRQGKARLPIVSIYRVSIGHLLKSNWIEQVIMHTFEDTFDKYLAQSLEYMAGKYVWN